MAKIIYFENQIKHFLKVQEIISADPYKHEVFPPKNDYREFINFIHIWLNNNYTPDIRNRVGDKIIKYLVDHTPDLFIIDYILMNCMKGETGIELHNKFSGHLSKIPVIFLSRTNTSDHRIISGLNRLECHHEWVYKGFQGDAILKKTYINDFLITKIDKLLKKSQSEVLIKEIKSFEFISITPSENLGMEFKNEIHDLNFILHKFIYQLDDYTDIGLTLLQRFLNELKSFSEKFKSDGFQIYKTKKDQFHSHYLNFKKLIKGTEEENDKAKNSV